MVCDWGRPVTLEVCLAFPGRPCTAASGTSPRTSPAETLPTPSWRWTVTQTRHTSRNRAGACAVFRPPATPPAWVMRCFAWQIPPHSPPQMAAGHVTCRWQRSHGPALSCFCSYAAGFCDLSSSLLFYFTYSVSEIRSLFSQRCQQLGVVLGHS